MFSIVRVGYAARGAGDREARAVGTALNSRKARTISKSGLVLKRENHPFKNNITAEPPRRSASSHGSILEFIPFKISIPPTLVPIKEVVSRSQIADSRVVTSGC
ncbi:hypothetical protein EFP23_08585 [Lacticaseibacillus paracasei]|nr:hypothetical protein [Lacticaseibacillus paracasei]MCT3344630.1 hypothetical protein [Lacticaseibacillus paracasei]